jgi:hypothetical protein
VLGGDRVRLQRATARGLLVGQRAAQLPLLHEVHQLVGDQGAARGVVPAGRRSEHHLVVGGEGARPAVLRLPLRVAAGAHRYLADLHAVRGAHRLRQLGGNGNGRLRLLLGGRLRCRLAD